jgi:hypothetical protein
VSEPTTDPAPAAPQQNAPSKGTTASGQPTTVAAMLDALTSGQMSTADAALWCAMHEWPPAPVKPPTTLAEIEARGQDVMLSSPGTFADVTLARFDGRITPGQYTALLYAVAGDRSARDGADRDRAASGEPVPPKKATSE